MLHFDYTLIITLIDEIKLYQISQFSNSILKQDFKEKQSFLACQPEEEQGETATLCTCAYQTARRKKIKSWGVDEGFKNTFLV